MYVPLINQISTGGMSAQGCRRPGQPSLRKSIYSVLPPELRNNWRSMGGIWPCPELHARELNLRFAGKPDFFNSIDVSHVSVWSSRRGWLYILGSDFWNLHTELLGVNSAPRTDYPCELSNWKISRAGTRPVGCPCLYPCATFRRRPWQLPRSSFHACFLGEILLLFQRSTNHDEINTRSVNSNISLRMLEISRKSQCWSSNKSGAHSISDGLLVPDLLGLRNQAPVTSFAIWISSVCARTIVHPWAVGMRPAKHPGIKIQGLRHTSPWGAAPDDDCGNALVNM